MFVMPMLWFWLASDARPSRALYSECPFESFEFEATKPIILGWVLLDELRRVSSQECASGLTGPCFTGPQVPAVFLDWEARRRFISKIRG